MGEEIKQLIGDDEKIYYEGKPYKKCFEKESIFNPLLPISILWTAFDSIFFIAAFASGELFVTIFVLLFLAFHMMPVWMYISTVLFYRQRFEKAYYIITDKCVYISSGTFNTNVKVLSFRDITEINMFRGYFDMRYDVGDIVFTTNEKTSNGGPVKVTLGSVAYYKEIYNVASKLHKLRLIG